MRELSIICQSSVKSREDVAVVLNRYFSRNGAQAWTGRASNRCLDRVAGELRRIASRSTSVEFFEQEDDGSLNEPIIRIGCAGHDDEKSVSSSAPENLRAAVGVAVLFHDLGKASEMFQEKLRESLRTGQGIADPVRHELISALVFDELFGGHGDADLVAGLANLTPEMIEGAWAACRRRIWDAHRGDDGEIRFAFARRTESLSCLIGSLILTHHRLFNTDFGFNVITGGAHVAANLDMADAATDIAPGEPFWRMPWFANALGREANRLGPVTPGIENELRDAMMFADHLGSARSVISAEHPDHLANTRDGQPADDLDTHVRKVYAAARHAVDLVIARRDQYPGLSKSELPETLTAPSGDHPRFRWQHDASSAAADVARTEGGFFAAIIAGTGTGKTRGAPAILSAATFSDPIQKRRSFRMTLGLGLRVLAKQSGREYVDDLGLPASAVSVLVGQTPLDFTRDGETDDEDELTIQFPEWLDVEAMTDGVPHLGSQREQEWLRGLSHETVAMLPPFAEIIAGESSNPGKFRDLIEPPCIVGTVDHVMGVAAPARSWHLPQTLRVSSSDLILDEIDQYDGEDIAALARLVYRTAASGRRVIAMSATLTDDIAEALFTAYKAGWRAFAASTGASDNVNALCTGDAPNSCIANSGVEDFGPMLTAVQTTTCNTIREAEPLRRAHILPACASWTDLVAQTDEEISRMHDAHHSEINGVRVSVGLVAITRIKHTAGMASCLEAGVRDDRLRLKICLHSQFPRLHREWIEWRLKRALTRKGDDPDAGIRELLIEFGVFERAQAEGCTDVEIVIVASPVIETGNDLDFDYGIIDLNSMRSVIQIAGRVRRHRAALQNGPNIAIMGRPLVEMDSGAVSRPGVETPPHEDTGVRRFLFNVPDVFLDRMSETILGDERFQVVSALPLLERDNHVPLRDGEFRVRGDMLTTRGRASPPGRYLDSHIARLSNTMDKRRKFRRSETGEIEVFLQGEDVADAIWMYNLTPGQFPRRLLPAHQNRLTVSDQNADGGWLFDDLTSRAWGDFGNARGALGGIELERLVSVRIALYEESDIPELHYDEMTGFTRGGYDDLQSPL